MIDHINNAIVGSALAPLSADQIRTLVLLARRAWKAQQATLDIETCDPVSSFDTWRRREVLLAVERPGLRFCRNEDYLLLEAHFLAMLGRKLQANRALWRAGNDSRRQALAKLRHEIENAGDVISNAEAYVAQIARCRFKSTNVEELGEKQLWSLVFDIRRNASRRRSKTNAPADRPRSGTVGPDVGGKVYRVTKHEAKERAKMLTARIIAVAKQGGDL